MAEGGRAARSRTPDSTGASPLRRPAARSSQTPLQARILALQNSAGNRVVQRLLAGSAADSDEFAADAISRAGYNRYRRGDSTDDPVAAPVAAPSAAEAPLVATSAAASASPAADVPAAAAAVPAAVAPAADVAPAAVAPVAPVEPVGPFAPVAPVDPVDPVGPDAPVDPAAEAGAPAAAASVAGAGGAGAARRLPAIPLPAKYEGEEQRVGWRAFFDVGPDASPERRAVAEQQAARTHVVTKHHSPAEIQSNTLVPRPVMDGGQQRTRADGSAQSRLETLGGQTGTTPPMVYAMSPEGQVVANLRGHGAEITPTGQRQNIHHSTMFAGADVAHAGHIGLTLSLIHI